MSSEQTIRRGVRNARYAAIPNHVFEDERLSMEARWLLGYLLSKPDNWTVVIGDITRRGNCGRDKARKMIAELVELGYAEREQVRDDGKFGASSWSSMMSHFPCKSLKQKRKAEVLHFYRRRIYRDGKTVAGFAVAGKIGT